MKMTFLNLISTAMVNQTKLRKHVYRLASWVAWLRVRVTMYLSRISIVGWCHETGKYDGIGTPEEISTGAYGTVMCSFSHVDSNKATSNVGRAVQEKLRNGVFFVAEEFRQKRNDSFCLSEVAELID